MKDGLSCAEAGDQKIKCLPDLKGITFHVIILLKTSTDKKRSMVRYKERKPSLMEEDHRLSRDKSEPN